ncbi:MAG TPA: mannose-1-phosphate guanylyltransferase [Acidimicrobiia bacterium]|nr:mannose-1-phosphate guanylyltransferase [Acidimicrobiia bacterium]
MKSTVRPVILSGGSGTRLWPVSTRERPKQFIDLVGTPLFEATLDRAGRVADDGRVLVVTGSDHVDAVEEALSDSDLAATVLVEPSGRNTAPAIIAAALSADPADVLLVMPSDHLITDTSAFVAAVGDAVAVGAGGSLVTFGVVPTRPETGYGYIEKGDPFGPAFRVTRFKEKPDPDEATRLVADGRHLWNSGMFLFRASALLEEAERLAPDILETVRASVSDPVQGRVTLGARFITARSISIDHAILESAKDVAVVPLHAGWSDIGSWQSVSEIGEQDEAGNILIGDVVALDVKGSYVRSSSRIIAIAGVDGLVVVETPDVVLIIPKDQSQLVRDLAAHVEQSRRAD